MNDLLLMCMVAGRRAAIPAIRVQSVIEIEDITPIPGAPAFIRGLTALRSQALTVIDCSVALGFETAQAPPDQRAAVVEIDGHLYALLVDAAYDVGEAIIQPGDLPCTARRGAYRTLDERRAHLGIGARTHCDIVVKVDEASDLILAIGGNVRGSVRLKLWPAERREGRPLYPMDQSRIPGGRAVFAHLKLRADPVKADTLDNSPTIKALGEQDDALGWLRQVAAAREVAAGTRFYSAP